MGIIGLTTYIHRHSKLCMEQFNLHDTYLVIDGSNFCGQMLNRSQCSCGFGGDYDIFSKCLEKFFDDLAKCNITPLVLLDGGKEDKKMKTILRRKKDNVINSGNFDFSTKNRFNVYPLLSKEVLKCVMHEKGIRCVQTIFEADNDIAAIARALHCPVLSYDSDFFIYDVTYIPFVELERQVVRNPTCNGYMIPCKIYKVDFLLQNFRGLARSVLPIISTLLGNDCVAKNTFDRFFDSLTLPPATVKLSNDLQRTIDGTLNWLRGHSLETAIAGILGKLPKKNRKNVLGIIETIVNGYAKMSSNILIPLGFSPIRISQLMHDTDKEHLEFHRNIEDLNIENENFEDEEEEVEKEEGDVMADEEVDTPLEEGSLSRFGDDDSIFHALPKWFIDDFGKCHFPTYFIDMLARQLYVMPTQTEDYTYDSSNLISLRLVQVIYKLLSKGVLEPCQPLKYIVRANFDTKICTLEYCDEISNYKFPSLFNLRDLPMADRKQILEDALSLNSSLGINELLYNWQLYIATVLYWLKQDVGPPRNKLLVYVVLFAILFGIVDYEIGYHRSRNYFAKQYEGILDGIIGWRKNRKGTSVNQLPENISLRQAVDEVTADDCFMAANFFISNFERDQSFTMNPTRFNATSLHYFAQLQNCLAHSMHLNALLGYPYRQTKISELLNGTLLYNLYNNFKGRTNIDYYIAHVLEESQSLLRLFRMMLSKVQSLCEDNEIEVFANKTV